MNQAVSFFDGAVSRPDQYLLWTFGFVLAGFIVGWLARTRVVIQHFLKASREVLGVPEVPLPSWRLFFSRHEVSGIYKGRDVQVGVRYSGIKNAFLPLPLICMMLKETMGYNTARLPQYAVIEKNTLVFLPKANLPWSVFDKAFDKVFSKNYLILALEKMMATAEDLERGHPSREVFS